MLSISQIHVHIYISILCHLTKRHICFFITWHLSSLRKLFTCLASAQLLNQMRLHLAVLVLGNIYSDFFPLAGFSSRRPMYVVKKLKYIQKKTAFQRINYWNAIVYCMYYPCAIFYKWRPLVPWSPSPWGPKSNINWSSSNA